MNPLFFLERGIFLSCKQSVQIKKTILFYFFSIQQTDELDCSSFTFEQFYQLYLKVCGRLEIEQLCIRW